MPDVLPLSDPDFHEAGEIRLREEREPGAVLAAALNLATREARPLFTAVFAIVGPMVLLAAMARVLAPGDVGTTAGSLLDVTASLLSSAAVLGFVRCYAAGLPTEVGDVWDEAKRLVGPLLSYAFLLAVIVIALAVPVSLAIVGLGRLSLALTGVATIALVVAGVVYVLPPISLGLVAVGLDGMRPREALLHAHELARGRRRRVVLTLLLMAAIGLFAVVVLGGIVGGLVVAGAVSGDLTGGPAKALTSAVLTLVMVPVGVVSSLAWCVLYGSLVDIVEGASLGSDLERLAGTDLLGGARRPEARPPAGSADVLDDLRAAVRDEAPPESFRPDGDAADGEAPPSGFRGGGFRSP